jgi:hypothetical protein
LSSNLSNKAWPGHPADENKAPYCKVIDTSPTQIGYNTVFSDKQRAILIAANIAKNGKLVSDYYGLDASILPADYKEKHQVLRVPESLAQLVKAAGQSAFLTCSSDDPDGVQIDHIIPSTKQGSNDFRNAACCSRACNITKGNTTIQTLINNFI